jgi:hypothetical protein
MSLSDLASLGNFVSGVAVLVSLVFLYFQLSQISEQVKQAEKNQRASIASGRATRLYEGRFRTCEPHLAQVLLKVHHTPSDLSEVELLQYRNYVHAALISFEDNYRQHASGLLVDDAYEITLKGVKGLFSLPAARATWPRLRPILPEDFAAFIDRQISVTAVQPFVLGLEQFKIDVAAEVSKAA